MVDLLTVKRVLALDLGMDTRAIESYLGEQWPEASQGTAFTLDRALLIVAGAERSLATA